MAKHYVLVDDRGNKTAFVGDHIGQNQRGDDYYVNGADDDRTLVHVDHRDGVWNAIAPKAEEDVIRHLFVDGERILAERIAEALELDRVLSELTSP